MVKQCHTMNLNGLKCSLSQVLIPSVFQLLRHNGLKKCLAETWLQLFKVNESHWVHELSVHCWRHSWGLWSSESIPFHTSLFPCASSHVSCLFMVPLHTCALCSLSRPHSSEPFSVSDFFFSPFFISRIQSTNDWSYPSIYVHTFFNQSSGFNICLTCPLVGK